jgi:hypothetical protein
MCCAVLHHMSDLQLGRVLFQLGHWYVKINTPRSLRCSASSLDPVFVMTERQSLVKGKHNVCRTLIISNYLRCERSRVPNLRCV